MRFRPALIGILAALLWSAPAYAVFYGPPVPDLKEGELAVGVAVTDINRKIRVDGGGTDNVDNSRETLLGDYGLSNASMLRLELSTVDLDELRGNEVAVGYRRRVGAVGRMGKEHMPLHKGVFASLRSASLSEGGTDADFLQLDVGAGAQLIVNRTVSIYAGGVFSLLDGTIENRGFEGDSNVGLFGGAGFNLEENMRLGGELHMLMDSGFALFFRFVF